MEKKYSMEKIIPNKKSIPRKKKYNEDDRVSTMIEHPGVGDRIVDVIVILLCALVAFCSIIPMWHVLMSSFSEGQALLSKEGLVLWPVGEFNLEGYAHIFKDASIIDGYGNTLFYTITSVALGFMMAAMGGYAISRQTRLRTPMILFLTATMLFGGGMVPTYMVINALGWGGTPLALVIPGCTNGMFSIMMMNAFNSVPHEMYEAARIDGAGHFTTMWKIMLPQAMNLGSVIILNSVIAAWNAWLPASIYVPRSRHLWPLQLVINQLINENKDFLDSANPDYSKYLIQFAAIIVAAAPLILLFPFFQNKLEKGVIGGGVKG